MGEEERNEPQEVKEVKLGRWATVALVFGLVVVVFILVITFRGCSVQKSVNSNPTGQTVQTSAANPPETTTNVPKEPSLPAQTKPSFEGSPSAPVENPTIENNGSSTGEDSGLSKDGAFAEVADPVLSEIYSDFGMVVGKHIYVKGGSYIYGVNVSVVINESSVMAEYFCPRKTYEGLSSGDSLKVQYQLDSTGNISIYSISRG